VLPCALLTALLLGAVLIWASGASVFEAYRGLFEGMCGSRRSLVETCVAAIPYMLTGLSVALGFHTGLFNIGAEGQFYMGALGAAVVGYAVVGVSAWIHLPLALLAAALCGAAWGAIPGWLKARFGAHEVINTIMLNYVAVKLVDYLVKQVLRDPSASLDRTPYIQAPRCYRCYWVPIIAYTRVCSWRWRQWGWLPGSDLKPRWALRWAPWGPIRTRRAMPACALAASSC